jgi:hypothetical protein
MMRHLRTMRLLFAALTATSVPIAHLATTPAAVVTVAVASAGSVAAIAAPDVAYAGYTLDGSDDRIDIGTWGGFGSQINDADGWSVMCWANIPSQTSVATLMGSFTTGAQGVVGSFNQSFIFDVQTTWTTDYASSANHVLFDFGDKNDNGVLWHQGAGITVAGTGRHHYALTAIATGGGSGAAGVNSSATIVWYTDGTPLTSWTKPFSDGLGTMVNFSNTLAIGAERKNGGTWFDWTNGTFSGCRVYLVALTAQEITDIYKGNGRDNVTRGLHRSWPLQGVCRETLTGDTCTPQNGPTLTTVNELSGTRRR